MCAGIVLAEIYSGVAAELAAPAAANAVVAELVAARVVAAELAAPAVPRGKKKRPSPTTATTPALMATHFTPEVEKSKEMKSKGTRAEQSLGFWNRSFTLLPVS